MKAVRVISSALSVFCQHRGKTNALINMLIISSATLNIVLYFGCCRSGGVRCCDSDISSGDNDPEK
jgi:hypothetical protein